MFLATANSPTRQLANSSIAGPVALVELAKAVHVKLAMMV